MSTFSIVVGGLALAATAAALRYAPTWEAGLAVVAVVWIAAAWLQAAAVLRARRPS